MDHSCCKIFVLTLFLSMICCLCEVLVFYHKCLYNIFTFLSSYRKKRGQGAVIKLALKLFFTGRWSTFLRWKKLVKLPFTWPNG